MDLTTGRGYFSPAYFTMLGYQPDELPGNIDTFYSLLHPDDKDRAKEHYENWIHEGKEYSIEFRLMMKDGEPVWILSKGTVVKRSPEGEPLRVLGVHSNISSYKRALVALQEARDEAENANHSKSEFFARMSHEIRTPMNAILGMAHLAQDTSLNLEQEQYIQAIEDAAKSLLDIINDVLDLSKIEANKLTIESVDFDLEALLDRVGGMMRFKTEEKGLELVYDIASRVPRYMIGDQLRLGQVLTNLLSNAVKFTERGKILLTVDVRRHIDNKIELQFCVSDSGIGMSPEQQQLLFSPFTQASRSIASQYGGTGLGLAICKHLVELLGGEIGVQSEEGKGSQFTFTSVFEVSGKSSEQVGADTDGREVKTVAADTLDLSLLKGVRVLLAEDNIVNQRVAAGILKKKGVEVTLANNGREAIEAFRVAGSRDFDLILMDVEMPELDGFEATKEIRQHFPECKIPIIAMTAHAMRGDRERCLAAGMDAYVSKPIDPQQLYRTIAGCLSHSIGAK